eukprot:EST48067.1 Hypothetical protein SS50377_11796 [Spironucleus salmonicida]
MDDPERLLKQNGLQTLGFMLKIRPAKRLNHISMDIPKEFGHEDMVAISRLKALERKQEQQRIEVAKWRKIFTVHNTIGVMDPASESDSILFDQIPRRFSAKEFATVSKTRKRVILPGHK